MSIKRALCCVILAAVLSTCFCGCASKNTIMGEGSVEDVDHREIDGFKNISVTVDFSSYTSNVDELDFAQDLIFYGDDGCVYYAEEENRTRISITYTLEIENCVDTLYASVPVIRDMEFFSEPIEIVVEDGAIVGNTYNDSIILESIDVYMAEEGDTYRARYVWDSLSEYFVGGGEAYNACFSSRIHQTTLNTTSVNDPYGSFITKSSIDLYTIDEIEANEWANNITLSVDSVVRYIVLEDIVICSEDINVVPL